MRLALFALLTVLPLAEIAVLVKFGQWAGVWLTLAVVVGTAVVGVGVLQRQGLTMMLRTQEAMRRGEPPVGAMMEGAMSVIAGALLIMPGLITDAIGLLLLVPPVRHFVAGRLAAGMFGAADVHVEIFESERRYERRPGSGGPGVENGGPVIEGDFKRLDERTVDPDKGRPNDKS
ncbi:MAG: FxsA family protein [Hyphomicrobiaceae bacterium]